MIRVAKIYSIYYTKKFSLLFNQLFSPEFCEGEYSLKPDQTGLRRPQAKKIKYIKI